MNKKLLFLALVIWVTGSMNAQSLFISGGTSGIGTSSNGNVGIGTNTPSVKLNISGDHYDTQFLLHSLGGGSDDKQADLALWASESGWTYSGVGIGNNVLNSLGGVKRINNVRGGSYIRLLDNSMVFNVVSNTGIDLNSIAINSIGNIGIGTSNPLHKLEVYNGGIVSSLPSDQPWGFGIKTSASWGGWGRQYAFFSSDGTQLAAFGATGLYNGNQISSVYIGEGINSNGYEGTRWLSILTTNGNVGIGTPDPKNKLDVNGTIHAREVKVDLIGWADFVFTPTYKLRPLSEVEQFIKTNGHLPEIPKAEEVQQTGVNLGKMQTKLLQKVEELTLYSIEQEKQLHLQKLSNEVLEDKLARQEKINITLQEQLAVQSQEIAELKQLISKK